MSRKKHIAIVTTWFYPNNRVACYRMNSFAKYLDHAKYDISVITIQSEEPLKAKERVFDCDVTRVPSNRWLKKRRQKTTDGWFMHRLKSVNNMIVTRLSKEDYPGWAKNAGSALKQLHKEKPIDAIISSYAPMDAHLAALSFVKGHDEVKWIADMRDEMSMNPFISAKEKKTLRDLEMNLSERIQALTSVSKPILDDFSQIMENEKIRFVEVRNGYDHEKEPLGNFNDTFTMLYAGTFYGKRKPDTFFEALLNLKEKGQLPDSWKFQLLGTHRNFHVPKELAANIEFLPTADNEAAVDKMFAADCNVLIHPPMGVKGVYTGKLFEYISAQKPVLALVDKDDVAAELILEQKAGFVADFYEVTEIEQALLNVLELWEAHGSLPFDKSKVKTLHRSHQAKIMESLLDEILSE